MVASFSKRARLATDQNRPGVENSRTSTAWRRGASGAPRRAAWRATFTGSRPPTRRRPLQHEGDSGGLLWLGPPRGLATPPPRRSVVAERSLRIACLVPVADGIGACSDAQRSSRAGEQRSRTRMTFAAPVPFTGSDTGPSETATTRKERRACRERPERDGVRRDDEPRGWTVNEIPTTPGSLPTVGSRSYGLY